ncbi:MAG TPA: hypothetical protein VK507_14985 [Iamia sp.]|nr:hypothetical protein [Iamia sp.]
MSRRIVPLLVALLGLSALAPLAPASPAGAAPAKTFTTDDGSLDPDIAPGDGVCATAAGGCSLQAAFDEAIALRKGTIVIDAGGYAASAVVRGTITVRGADRLTGAGIGHLRVERGATLNLKDLELNDVGSTYLVRGRLTIERSAYLSGMHGLRVDPSGTVVIRNSLMLVTQVQNLGALTLSYASLRVPPGGRGIQTSAAGVTTLAASHLFGTRGTGSRACGGNRPVSQGYNAAMDGTCGLTQPTDIGVLGPEGDDLLPPPDSPRADAVPPGELGCGTTVIEDQARRPRPADGNGDAVLACDVGWLERQPSDDEEF